MDNQPLIALAGNPNVGKSTIFNALTGLRQHTGNWPGKTVGAALGQWPGEGEDWLLMDVPGAYSLRAQSAEEEAAMEALCFGGSQAVIAVCSAAALERNLNLIFQVMEITDQLVVCVNLLDEARNMGMEVDLSALQEFLQAPVIGACAREGKGLSDLRNAVERVLTDSPHPRSLTYVPEIEAAATTLAAALAPALSGLVNPRFAALRLIEEDACFEKALRKRVQLSKEEEDAISAARNSLAGLDASALMVEAIYAESEACCKRCIQAAASNAEKASRADKIITHPLIGGLMMLSLLALVFFITLKGANLPSSWLSQGFSALEIWLNEGLSAIGTPDLIHRLLMDGIFSILSQVISVMLPPMAIFFPLFTLLEDSGYLPRVAFQLDGLFEKCHACGKQALTMCMGFGCNAVGVTGCRIIDSPRERMIALLTNNLTPCNGRFPLLIALGGLFFAGSDLKTAALLMGLILFSFLCTLLLSRLLSMTLLRGAPSSYTLELPPYRRPQFAKVALRSLFDRTLIILGRAAGAAVMAGIVIFLLGEIHLGGASLQAHITRFLHPLGRLMGLDGVILTAFLLGMPANEIVLPMILLGYAAPGAEMALPAMGEFLRSQGWTALTALNTMLFSLFHFPCLTTLITIRKETHSPFWTALSALLPTALGIGICILTTLIAKIF